MNPLRPALALALTLAAPLFAEPVYKDAAASPEARADELLSRMTLDEKVDLLSGVHDMDLRANARLGIPALRMTDGPLGVRNEVKTTAFPSGAAMAAGFDPDLVRQLAAAMGEETLATGRDMLLGPCVNIARAPQGGRNFESFGEDPFLAARMAAAYVVGLQSRGVLASTKHFALNNQETARMTVDVKAGERAMHEIFLPAFLAAVRAGTWTVMAAYNRINGHYASENEYLLEEVLKKRWGFQGWVVSDWGATHSTVEAANAGLDVEMPSGDFFGGGKLQKAVRDGKVPLSTVDDKVRRVLRTMFASGLFERKDSDRPPRSSIGSAGHRALALRAAQEGIVLLKNDGTLPLEKERTLAVLGPAAAEPRAGGGGSSEVNYASALSALEGLKQAGSGLKIAYAEGVKMPGDVTPIDGAWLSPPPGKGEGHGLYAEYFAGKDLGGSPAVTRVDPAVDFEWGEGKLPAPGLGPTSFSARWTGRLRVPKDGDYRIATRTDDGSRLWVDGRLIVDDWSAHPPITHSKRLSLKAGRDYDLKLEYYQDGGGATAQLAWLKPTGGQIAEAARLAKKADAAVVFVGFSDQLEGEGNDRESLALPDGQDALVEAVAKANKRTVVVVQAGGPVLMPWASKVAAILEAWYPGQEGGRAVADALLGRVNPSGRLPVTFPARWEDSPAYGHYPGGDSVDYAEGLYVGYRGFDKKGVAPLFPFGHGLSYTRFDYSDAAVEARDASAAAPDVEVSVTVKNAGRRAGAEVAQLYVGQEEGGPDSPPQELKGFERVELAPGESKRVSFRLGRDAFAHYDEGLHDWRVWPGRFALKIGASSRDIRAVKELALR